MVLVLGSACFYRCSSIMIVIYRCVQALVHPRCRAKSRCVDAAPIFAGGLTFAPGPTTAIRRSRHAGSTSWNETELGIATLRLLYRDRETF